MITNPIVIGETYALQSGAIRWIVDDDGGALLVCNSEGRQWWAPRRLYARPIWYLEPRRLLDIVQHRLPQMDPTDPYQGVNQQPTEEELQYGSDDKQR